MAVAAQTQVGHPGSCASEWWELLAGRGRLWAGQHESLVGRIRRVVVVGVWLCVPLVIVTYVAVPAVRQGVRVWLPIYWLLILWFLLARTRTVSWRLVATVFTVGVPWSLVIGLLSLRLTDLTGLPVAADGPRLAIAGLTEESLKLLPLGLLAALAPGRVRRFAVVDFLLVGLASGLAFQAFEEFLRRTYYAISTPGLLDLLVDPTRTGPESGTPQYGWGPLSGGASTDVASFGGHHVTTALTAVMVGLGVAAWRHGRRLHLLGRFLWSTTAVVAPVVMWWITVADHAGFNATGVLGRTWVETPRPSTPWVLRTTWDWTAEGAHRGLLLVLLLIVALLVDARRLRRADDTRPAAALPAGGWSTVLWAPGLLADAWCRAVTGWAPLLPADLPRTVAAAVRTAVAMLHAGCALAAYCLRDLAVVLAARSREPGESLTSAVLRGSAASTMLRTVRLEAMGRAAPVETRRSRWVARLLAVSAGALLLGAATWLATRLATEIGLSVIDIPGLDWLAGLLDRLADEWNKLGPLGQILIIAGIAALIVFSGGSFGVALTIAGGAGFLATHGHGAADFVRNPRRATTAFITNLTPQQLAGYALEIALARIIPAAVGGAAGRGIRKAVDDLRTGRPDLTATITPKIARQMGARGWTKDAIQEAMRAGVRVRAVNKATGNPATRYIHPTTGQSVVVDDVTREVIHVGGPGFKYGPESGDVP